MYLRLVDDDKEWTIELAIDDATRESLMLQTLKSSGADFRDRFLSQLSASMAASSSNTEEAIEIGAVMWATSIPLELISRAIVLANEFGDILVLMRLWRDEEDPREREATIGAIRQLVIDCSYEPDTQS